MSQIRSLEKRHRHSLLPKYARHRSNMVGRLQPPRDMLVFRFTFSSPRADRRSRSNIMCHRAGFLLSNMAQKKLPGHVRLQVHHKPKRYRWTLPMSRRLGKPTLIVFASRYRHGSGIQMPIG
jgi:hypothetical protein